MGSALKGADTAGRFSVLSPESPFRFAFGFWASFDIWIFGFDINRYKS